jgi:UDP-N-acetylglucosamine--N-acetylmuramyl-(pentapeptide) pyrophosphoryl-undecaprenol N-acetylglucosamine transferase
MADELKILFAGGGTGGHLYPGLAVAGCLRSLRPEARITFYATRRPIDRQVLEKTPYQAQYENVRGFSTRPWTWPAFGLSYVRSLTRARQFLESYRPQAVIGLGGFGSFAVVHEAQRAGLPNFILNPDLIVGRANRKAAVDATAVFCQFAETARTVRTHGRAEAVGCPIRESLFGIDRRQACETLGLDPSKKTLVVTGASSGARTINDAVVLLADRLGKLAQESGWQVLHLTGRNLCDDVRREVAAGGEKPWYVIRDYIDDMGLVYAVADLMIARAGAGTVAEITALGVPSVLLPYPFHRDRHQERHALLLQEAGAAVMIRDTLEPQKNGDALWPVLSKLMREDERRRAMAAAAKKFGRPEAARTIATEILNAVTAVAVS